MGRWASRKGELCMFMMCPYPPRLHRPHEVPGLIVPSPWVGESSLPVREGRLPQRLPSEAGNLDPCILEQTQQGGLDNLPMIPTHVETVPLDG